MSSYFFGGFSAYLIAAVGPFLEPFGMLFEPRMVGRALDGEIERHLHAVLLAGFDEAVEIVEGAELGMDGVVAAFGAADGVGAAGIVGPGLQ